MDQDIRQFAEKAWDERLEKNPEVVDELVALSNRRAAVEKLRELFFSIYEEGFNEGYHDGYMTG